MPLVFNHPHYCTADCELKPTIRRKILTGVRTQYTRAWARTCTHRAHTQHTKKTQHTHNTHSSNSAQVFVEAVHSSRQVHGQRCGLGECRGMLGLGAQQLSQALARVPSLFHCGVLLKRCTALQCVTHSLDNPCSLPCRSSCKLTNSTANCCMLDCFTSVLRRQDGGQGRRCLLWPQDRHHSD